MPGVVYNKNKKYISPGKIWARAYCYSKLSRKDMFTKYHIVIASTACGDIKFLIECGVDPQKIIACDVLPAAVEAAKQFGVIISKYGDIVETVRWANHEFGSANIASINADLCTTATAGAEFMRHIFQLGVLKNTRAFFTYLRGRDVFTSAEGRNDFISTHSGRKPIDEIEYQSYTKDSAGSPMGVTIF